MPVKLRTRRRDMTKDGTNHHNMRGLKQVRGQVQWPFALWQVQVPMRSVITPIHRLPTLMRHIVRVIPHIWSCRPHCCHIHPTTLSFSSTTLPSLKNTMLCYPTLSLQAMIMSWHWVQHILTTAYTKSRNTEYSIHKWICVIPSFPRFGVYPSMLIQFPACVPTRLTVISQLAMRPQTKSYLVTFPHLRINWLMNRGSTPWEPSINRVHALVQSRSITASNLFH